MADPLSMTASIIAIAQVSCTIITTAMGYYGGVVDAREDILRLRSELRGLDIVLDSLHDIINSTPTSTTRLQTLTASQFLIDDCRSVMDKINKKLGKPVTGLKLGARLVWPLKEKDINKLATIISRQRDILAAALGKDHLYVHFGMRTN